MANSAHRETSAEKITGLVEKDKGGDFTDVRKALLDEYKSHPQLYNGDLAAASKAMQDKNILPPGTFITGVDGEDFVIKSKDGKVGHRSATDMGREKQVGEMTTTVIGGRDAKLGPDGSGTVKAKAGDEKWQSWGLAKDVLQAQGITKPSDTEVANFALQLKKLNGHIKPGQEIKVPGRTKDGEQTDFAPTPGAQKLQPQLDAVPDVAANPDLKQGAPAEAAPPLIDDGAKLASTGDGFMQTEAGMLMVKDMLKAHGNTDDDAAGKSISKEKVYELLNDPKLPASERKDLMFMAANFDKLSDDHNPDPSDHKISETSLANWFGKAVKEESGRIINSFDDVSNAAAKAGIKIQTLEEAIAFAKGDQRADLKILKQSVGIGNNYSYDQLRDAIRYGFADLELQKLTD